MKRCHAGSLAAAVTLLLVGLFTGSARATSLNCSEPYALGEASCGSVGVRRPPSNY